MKDSLILKIQQYLADTDYKNNVSTKDELAEAEIELNVKLDEDYKIFISNFGGCYVGLDVFGLKNSSEMEQVSFVDLTKSFIDQGIPDMSGKYVISFDGSGNPIVMDESGRVFLFNHDIGNYEELSESFSQLIMDNI